MGKLITCQVLVITLLLCTSSLAGENRNEKTEKDNTAIEWKTDWDQAAKEAERSEKLIFLVLTYSGLTTRDKGILEDSDLSAFVNANFVPALLDRGKNAKFPFEAKVDENHWSMIFVLDHSKNIILELSGIPSTSGLKTLLQKAIEARSLLGELEKDPDSLDINYRLAKMYLDLNRNKDAARLLEKVCELDPENRENKKVDALFLLGGIELSGRNYDAANRRFAEILKLDPDDKNGYRDDIAIQQALMESYTRKYKEAIEKLENFIKNFPESKLLPEAYYHLGATQYLQKDREGAEKTFRKLVAEFPDSKQANDAKQMLQLFERMKAPRRSG